MFTEFYKNEKTFERIEFRSRTHLIGLMREEKRISQNLFMLGSESFLETATIDSFEAQAIKGMELPTNTSFTLDAKKKFGMAKKYVFTDEAQDLYDVGRVIDNDAEPYFKVCDSRREKGGNKMVHFYIDRAMSCSNDSSTIRDSAIKLMTLIDIIQLHKIRCKITIAFCARTRSSERYLVSQTMVKNYQDPLSPRQMAWWLGSVTASRVPFFFSPLLHSYDKFEWWNDRCFGVPVNTPPELLPKDAQQIAGALYGRNKTENDSFFEEQLYKLGIVKQIKK
jgi:hypothetical protein